MIGFWNTPIIANVTPIIANILIAAQIVSISGIKYLNIANARPKPTMAIPAMAIAIIPSRMLLSTPILSSIQNINPITNIIPSAHIAPFIACGIIN